MPRPLRPAEDELLTRRRPRRHYFRTLLVTKTHPPPDALLVPTAWTMSVSLPLAHAAAGPEDIAGIERPIFGFFGLIHHWIDCSLIARVAELRPNYSFVLIGDCKSDVNELRDLSTSIFLAADLRNLPAYCAAFNAGYFLRSERHDPQHQPH